MLEEPISEKGAEKPEKAENRASLRATMRFAVILVGAVLIAVLVTHSVMINRFAVKESEEDRRFRVLQQYLESVAYYDYEYDQMLEEAVRAYVGSSGDDYTIYYNDEEFKQLTQANQGNYVGIGISVEEAETMYEDEVIRALRIAVVRKNSPAQRAGLLKGDEIVAITTEQGAVRVNDVSNAEATALIRGEAGSSVGLSVLREVSHQRVQIDVTLVREELTLESVEYRISETDPTVGILTITNFDLKTPDSLEKGMDALLAKGAERFVIDLRDNGGGDLSSVVACASFFLKKNEVILSTKNKDGVQTVYNAKVRNLSGNYASCSVSAEDIGKYLGYPYAILINGNTASAAELLTAVFRDYSRGIVVGEKSYGKGSVQGIYSLAPVGLEGGIRVTTKMYFPPSGEGYNGIGIMPDISVAFPEDKVLGATTEAEDTQMMCAIENLLVQASK